MRMTSHSDKLARSAKLFNPGGGFYDFFLKSTKSGAPEAYPHTAQAWMMPNRRKYLRE
jgi:hypothetical protein